LAGSASAWASLRLSRHALMGQTHVPHYHHQLLKRIEAGEIDPSFVITHRMALDDAPEGYKMFRDKEDKCIKIVLKP
jgi:threonine dehydrogenase-like Zn-dependent dehydrogenase